MPAKFNVLFLCTANSARSIMAEAILNHVGAARFAAFSAGSEPAGSVHPRALDVLARMEVPTAGLRSKHWDEFAGAAAPSLDFVFTVCDRAAQETCPAWSGQPLTAQWSIADPVVDAGDELARLQRFRTAFAELERRIGLFVNLPFTALDGRRLQPALDDIARR
ncbi:MAG: arsenate reductase ArsC [Gammaproteobacteria bacterium]